MSRLEWATQVFDNDMHGLDGRGTGFWLTIVPDARSKLGSQIIQYRLFDELDGWFDRWKIMQPYFDEQAEFDKIDAKPKEEKVVQEITDATIIKLATNLIDSMSDTEQDYRKGKPKALNVLVGAALKTNKMIDPAGFKLLLVDILDRRKCTV